MIGNTIGPGHRENPDTGIILALCGSSARPLQVLLENEGFHVSSVDNHVAMLKLVRETRPDLLVLDARNKNLHYPTICDNLRRFVCNLQILVLLPTREMTTILRALGNGADDCLVAPFSYSDVLVRIRILLCRQQQQRQSRRSFARVEILPDERQVLVDGTALKLTVLEFSLLDILSNWPDVVIPRDRLAAIAWGEDGVSDCRLVDAHICRLRKKLRSRGLPENPIQSVR
ncbi:MAG TPA: response regulator transcription factor, partial [Armatimonadota bacterium]